MPYKSTSLSPTTLVFSHKPRYIRQFSWKTIWGAPPKITPHFLDFSKKTRPQKTRFFQDGRNFGHRFLKKGPKSSIFGASTAKIIFDKLSIKKLRHLKNFGRDPPHRHFMAYFRKSVFQIFISQISLVISPENLWKALFFFIVQRWQSNSDRRTEQDRVGPNLRCWKNKWIMHHIKVYWCSLFHDKKFGPILHRDGPRQVKHFHTILSSFKTPTSSQHFHTNFKLR